ncbi:MAG: beta-ketoacyl synthase, partial [Proteobacteria bacterium]|nr:beta-ketoacyl synthase [Pseudomonadota bacterium]
MAHLPIIVGFGGVNPAGRSSFHHGFRRLVIDQLNPEAAAETYTGLATMMGLLRHEGGEFVDREGNPCPPEQIAERFGGTIRENTLLRKINPEIFDVDHIPINRKIKVDTGEASEIRLLAPKKDLPDRIPSNWKLKEIENDPDHVELYIRGSLEFYQPDRKEALVQTAGQIPTGFDPGKLYNSRHHPRGLQMAVYSATDAILSVGIDWEEIRNAVRPDQIGVYAGSGHGQMDDTGGGGLMKALALGRRTSSRHLPLSLVDMPSNFINAYIIGNVGHTGTQKAACATFLYNLDLAVKEIQAGRRRVAIVGNSEAPILPELLEGYKAMSALAEDARLMKLNDCRKLTHEHR